LTALVITALAIKDKKNKYQRQHNS